ncbi:MAG: peptidase M14 [Gemmatimonas sp.]|nr:peptidase M14 [Gemmatimonas sp.]
MTILRTLTAVALAVLLSVARADAQTNAPDPLLTAPERTDFIETTRYVDVRDFMRSVADASPLIHLTTFGYTMEGRALPLAVVGRIADPSPAGVRASGRTVIYLQGGIHAGEVEGKEVLLMLLREVAQGQHGELLDSLVLLVAPVLNADGNERVELTNRPLQHGPIGGMGTRANAQGLNINRDHMKLDTPEARSFAQMLNAYDPDIGVDLHTTNGTRHAYHLTYSPPLHPSTDPRVTGILNQELFPRLRDEVRRRYGWEFYDYGNLQGEGESRGWYTFDYRALFNNNYLGLRNRLGVLSEAYSYATFEERIVATKLFVEETLGFAHENATEIRRLVEEVDGTSLVGETLTVRAEPERSAEPVEILLGGTTEERNPYSGAPMLRRTDERRAERMSEYLTFAPTVEERVPAAYLVPPELAEVLATLETHGVSMEALTTGDELAVERFIIEQQDIADQEFEGRIERTIEGNWESDSVPLPEGWFRIPLDQPLGRLIFALLEPRSADGLATWGTLGDVMDGASHYPILRVP